MIIEVMLMSMRDSGMEVYHVCVLQDWFECNQLRFNQLDLFLNGLYATPVREFNIVETNKQWKCSQIGESEGSLRPITDDNGTFAEKQ